MDDSELFAVFIADLEQRNACLFATSPADFPLRQLCQIRPVIPILAKFS